MPETYKDWVTRRIAVPVDEMEPFCPFYGPEKTGYCNMAYSDNCYACEEARGEWEVKHKCQTKE